MNDFPAALKAAEAAEAAAQIRLQELLPQHWIQGNETSSRAAMDRIVSRGEDLDAIIRAARANCAQIVRGGDRSDEPLAGNFIKFSTLDGIGTAECTACLPGTFSAESPPLHGCAGSCTAGLGKCKGASCTSPFGSTSADDCEPVYTMMGSGSGGRKRRQSGTFQTCEGSEDTSKLEWREEREWNNRGFTYITSKEECEMAASHLNIDNVYAVSATRVTRQCNNTNLLANQLNDLTSSIVCGKVAEFQNGSMCSGDSDGILTNMNGDAFGAQNVSVDCSQECSTCGSNSQFCGEAYAQSQFHGVMQAPVGYCVLEKSKFGGQQQLRFYDGKCSAAFYDGSEYTAICKVLECPVGQKIKGSGSLRPSAGVPLSDEQNAVCQSNVEYKALLAEREKEAFNAVYIAVGVLAGLCIVVWCCCVRSNAPEADSKDADADADDDGEENDNTSCCKLSLGQREFLAMIYAWFKLSDLASDWGFYAISLSDNVRFDDEMNLQEMNPKLFKNVSLAVTIFGTLLIFLDVWVLYVREQYKKQKREAEDARKEFLAEMWGKKLEQAPWVVHVIPLVIIIFEDIPQMYFTIKYLLVMGDSDFFSVLSNSDPLAVGSLVLSSLGLLVNLWHAGINRCVVPCVGEMKKIRQCCSITKYGKVAHHGFLGQRHADSKAVELILKQAASDWEAIEDSRKRKAGKSTRRKNCVPRMIWTNNEGVSTLSYMLTDAHQGKDVFEHISVRQAADGMTGFEVNDKHVSPQMCIDRFGRSKKASNVQEYIECVICEVEQETNKLRKVLRVPGPNERHAERMLERAREDYSVPGRRMPYLVWFEETSDGNVETVLSCQHPKIKKGIFQHIRLSQDYQDHLQLNGKRVQNEDHASSEPQVFVKVLLDHMESKYTLEREPVSNVSGGFKYDKARKSLVPENRAEAEKARDKPSFLRRVSYKLSNTAKKERQVQQKTLERQFMLFLELDNATEVDEDMNVKTLQGGVGGSSKVDKKTIKRKPSIMLKGANPGRSTETDDFDEIITTLTKKTVRNKSSFRKTILPSAANDAGGDVFNPDSRFAQIVGAKWSSHLAASSSDDPANKGTKYWNHLKSCYEVAVEVEKSNVENLDNVDSSLFDNVTGNGGYLHVAFEDEEAEGSGQPATLLNDAVQRSSQAKKRLIKKKKEKKANVKPMKMKSTDSLGGFGDAIQSLEKHGGAQGEFAAFNSGQFTDDSEKQRAVPSGNDNGFGNAIEKLEQHGALQDEFPAFGSGQFNDSSVPVLESADFTVGSTSEVQEHVASGSEVASLQKARKSSNAPPKFTNEELQEREEAAKVIQAAFRSFLNDGTLVNKQRKFGRQYSSYFSHRLLPVVDEAVRKDKQERGQWSDARKTWVMLANVPADVHIDLDMDARLDEEV